jgi:preprotein translocase subunit SecF
MKRVINFVKVRFIFITMSLILLAGFGVATAVQGGFNLGVDYSAGMSLHVVVAPEKAKAPIEEVRKALASMNDVQIQDVGDPKNQQYTVRTKQLSEDKSYSDIIKTKIVTQLEAAFGAGTVTILQSDYVGPRYSTELASQTSFLAIGALALILLYVMMRFTLGYAVAAIVATLHDVCFMIGFIGAFQLEVNTTTVAAVLTIIGYSLNDTIVVFDRIRENSGLMREAKLPLIINTSVTQTLARTIITSLTTFLAVLALFVFATGDVKHFGANMIVGIIVGTYSSIFIASPVLLSWRNQADKIRAKRETKKYGEPVAEGVAVEAPVETETSGASAAFMDTASTQEPAQSLSKRPPKMSREKRKRHTSH